jgi:Uma2 family endonuclease
MNESVWNVAMVQSDSPRRLGTPLPTMYDLPSEDPEQTDSLWQQGCDQENLFEPGLPDEFHDFQPQLLRETCQPPHYPAANLFIGTNLNLYYDSRHPLWHKRPDWFLVLGVPRSSQQEDLRWSYVVWDEGMAPFLVIELLSPGTEAEDLGQTLREINQPPTKWQVYEHLLRIPYYGLFDRYNNQFRLFQLVGTRYQEVPLAEQRFWFEEIDLGLGVWQGCYQDTVGQWLRWYDERGMWIPTPAERAEQEQQRAEQERQRAEQERQRAEQAQAQLGQAVRAMVAQGMAVEQASP